MSQPVPSWYMPPSVRLTLAAGQIKPGNINLNNRPIVRNLDGSISTVRSITITDNQGRAYLIPTVIRNPDGIGGRVVTNGQAIAHFNKTGENLGYFENEGAADKYAQTLHEAQARQYLPKAGMK
jgi:hypothetical protein